MPWRSLLTIYRHTGKVGWDIIFRIPGNASESWGGRHQNAFACISIRIRRIPSHHTGPRQPRSILWHIHLKEELGTIIGDVPEVIVSTEL